MHVGQQPVSLPTRARGKLTGALAGHSGPLPLPLALTWQTGFSQQLNSSTLTLLDTLGIEPRASRMLSGCDTTTPHALLVILVFERLQAKDTQDKTQP